MGGAFISLMILLGSIEVTICRKYNISNDQISYYEILNTTQITYTKVRRSSSHIRHVTFHTHQQNFTLHLRQNSEILSNDLKLQLDPALIDANSLYDGYVNKDYTSNVVAYIHGNGVITGIIMTSEDNYYIELLQNHVPNASNNLLIVYKESNVRSNYKLTSRTDGHFGVMSIERDITGKGQYTGKHQRVRRSEPNCTIQNLHVPSNNLCPIYIVADYTFFTHVGNSDKTQTIYHMLQAMRVTNNLFKEEVWDYAMCRIGFAVRGFHVYETDDVATTPSFNWKGTTSPESYDRLLRLFSLDKTKLPDWNERRFCLAHLFTYRDFTHNVLGFAYIGSQETFGICNAQNVAFSNYFNSATNIRLLTQQANLVTAHEIAHNFGARHDNDFGNSRCSPGGDEGNFLMFDRIVPSTKPNNNRLSSCSKKSISELLMHKLKSKDCFIAQKDGALCSNGVVESGEECDAGIFIKNDPCCDKNCQLKDGALCSDFNDVCCSNCTFTAKNQSKICRHRNENSCQDKIFCNGSSAKCPTDRPKFIVDNDITCNYGRGNCTKEGCVPVCKQKGMLDCSCSTIGLNDCFLCCMDNNKTCIQIRTQWDGSQCTVDNERGRCKSGKCNKVKDDAGIEFLKDFSKFARFLKENIVGTVAVFSLFFWAPVACLVHYLDKKQEVENVIESHWRHPSNSALILDKGARQRLRHLFKKNTGSAKKVAGGRFHISS